MDTLSQKQAEFVAAMARYEGERGYARFGHLVAAGNVLLQLTLLALALAADISWIWHVLLFGAAYLVADFINGFVHLLMDNRVRYRGVLGPIVANFHLHHLRISYEQRPLYAVYYLESRSKVWLLVVQSLAVALALFGLLPNMTVPFLAYFAVLSSVAEVSHYACHSLTGPWIERLARWGLILPKKHHRWHHARDNCNYAFLNGVSDPILNAIASRFFAGYKTRSDLHSATYDAQCRH